MSKATGTITLSIEQLNATALRLRERSDEIHQLSLQDLRRDLLIAARCADLLAHVKFVLGEIMTSDPAVEGQIRVLLDDIENGKPKVGEA